MNEPFESLKNVVIAELPTGNKYKRYSQNQVGAYCFLMVIYSSESDETIKLKHLTAVSGCSFLFVWQKFEWERNNLSAFVKGKLL